MRRRNMHKVVPIETHRECSHCLDTKPIERFAVNGSGKPGRLCKDCRNSRAVERERWAYGDPHIFALAQKFLLMPRPRYT